MVNDGYRSRDIHQSGYGQQAFGIAVTMTAVIPKISWRINYLALSCDSSGPIWPRNRLNN